jgi:hypothetical protein
VRALGHSDTWECAGGDGAMYVVLAEACKTVISSDLYDRGFGEIGVEFLSVERLANSIITNPPYNCAEGFVRAGQRHSKRKLSTPTPCVRTCRTCIVLGENSLRRFRKALRDALAEAAPQSHCHSPLALPYNPPLTSASDHGTQRPTCMLSPAAISCRD